MVIALVLLTAGVLCTVAAALLLRSLGARYRVGRLLAATPEVSIDEALTLAGGPPTYVRVNGRISSDEEFPDENDRPLVYRRKRLEVAVQGGRWRALADEREAVPFGVETRSSFIAVDEGAIAEGLVAIPREAAGTADDLPADLRAAAGDDVTGGELSGGAVAAGAVAGGAVAGVTPDTPARLIVEQLSAVEHASVCGVPALLDGRPSLTAGLGRPLIVTTLAIPEAIRLLGAAHRRRVRAAALLLFVGIALGAAALIAAVLGA